MLTSLFHFSDEKLDADDVLRLKAFLAFHDGEFDLLAFDEFAIAITNDCFKVNKNIGAIGSFDKAIAFSVIEPFYGSAFFLGHDLELLSKNFKHTWFQIKRLIFLYRTSVSRSYILHLMHIKVYDFMTFKDFFIYIIRFQANFIQRRYPG